MESGEGRFKGVRKDDGKILKGTLTQAPLKLKASSIPSKNQNVIYSNHHKSAFGNSQERFYTPINQKTEQSPGPGNYNPLNLPSKVQSKKGSGIFASATKLTRFNDKKNWNPGPGRYDFSINKNNRTKSTYQFSTNSSVRQLFKDEVRTAGKLPGPADYQERMRRSATTYNSIFKSNVNRFRTDDSQIPPVGMYRWEQTKRKIFSLKFAQKAQKHNQKNTSIHYKHMERLIGKKTDNLDEIGPGKYVPNILSTNKGFTIRQSNIDRFGTVKYKFTIDSKLTSNHDILIPKEQKTSLTKANPHSSVFKSKSRRYDFGQREKEIVGDPGHYSPSKVAQQSHIINFAQKWI